MYILFKTTTRGDFDDSGEQLPAYQHHPGVTLTSAISNTTSAALVERRKKKKKDRFLVWEFNSGFFCNFIHISQIEPLRLLLPDRNSLCFHCTHSFFLSVSPSRIRRFVCIRQCSEHMCCRIITMSRKIKACPFMCVFSVCSGKVYSFFFVSVCDFQVPSSSSINVDADKVSSSSLLECSLCSSVKVVVFFWFTTSLHYLCLKCH